MNVNETLFIILSILFWGPGLFCLAFGTMGTFAYFLRLPPFDGDRTK